MKDAIGLAIILFLLAFFAFPALEIYTTVENFAAEMEQINFQDLRFFIEEITEESIELEVWR